MPLHPGTNNWEITLITGIASVRLKKIAGSESGDERFYLNQAQQSISSGDYVSAKHSLAKAEKIAEGKKNRSAMFNIADNYRRMGEIKQAKSCEDRANSFRSTGSTYISSSSGSTVTRNDTSHMSELAKGMAYARQGKKAEASKCFNNSMKLAESTANVNGLIDIGDGFLRIEDKSNANKCYYKAKLFATNKRDYRSLYFLVSKFRNLGNTQAENDCKKKADVFSKARK